MTPGRCCRCLVLIAAVLAVGCLPPRPDLPPPVQPFTRTPDAAFRQRPPAPPQGAQGTEMRVPRIERMSLNNGVIVYTVERREFPLVVSAFVSATAGAANAPEQPGLAELAARCLVRGTRFADGKILRNLHVDRQAPRIDVGPESARLLLQTLPDAAARAVHLLAAAVRHPVFLSDQVEAARWEQLEQLRDQSNSLMGLMLPLGARLIYGDAHVLSADAREVHARTRQYSVAAVRGFYTQNYHPASSALVVPILDPCFAGRQRAPKHGMGFVTGSGDSDRARDGDG